MFCKGVWYCPRKTHLQTAGYMLRKTKTANHARAQRCHSGPLPTLFLMFMPLIPPLFSDSVFVPHYHLLDTLALEHFGTPNLIRVCWD